MTQYSSAKFSEDRVHRYALWRTWGDPQKIAMFIGLNPSTADEIIRLLEGIPMHCLDINKTGQPKHPLYCSNEINPIEFVQKHK